MSAIARLPDLFRRGAEAFLAAIAARPNDDLPRLIFADWLDEHGDADRAEFIRMQYSADPDAAERAAELQSVHRREWLAELPGVYHAEFRRGFPEHIVVPASTFLAVGAALRRRMPVRSVALLGAGSVLEDLLDGRLLDGLTGLHLTDALIGDEGVARLADAACLRDLEILRLARTGLGDVGATALARSPNLTRLRTLVLRGNTIADVGAWDLARSGMLSQLKEFDLAENEIGPSGVAALTSAFAGLDVSGQRDPARWWRRTGLK